jgi:hypothetical protein
MSGAKLDATPESLGYRQMTAKERSACEGSDCKNCAQPKISGSDWMADHSGIDLCIFPCPRPFVKDRSRPAPKPKKWEPVDLIDGSHRTQANGAWYDRLLEASATINTLGRKLTALQNKAKEKKA